MNEVLTIDNKKNEKFLRKDTLAFDFSSMSKKDIQALVTRMRKIMHEANGIGLSANQIGLSYRLFVAEVPDARGGTKFYAVFNPRIEKTSGEKELLEEGCLSIPGSYGMVPRYETVTLTGQDKNGKSVKIKAWGLLAHVFQHETDHLAGILYIDKAKHLYETPTTTRLKEREKKSK